MQCSSFGVDALSVFFFFLETTSFHSPGGERSVVVSKSVAVVGVLGLTSGGALLSSMYEIQVTDIYSRAILVAVTSGCRVKWDIGKQCRPRSDAAESALFA